MSYYQNGTVSVATGSTALSAALTTFVSQAKVGDLFACNGITVPIAAVVDSTNLTLASPWPGESLSAEADYQIVHVSDLWFSAVTLNENVVALIQKIDSGLPFQPHAYGTLAQRAAYDDALPPFFYAKTDASPWIIFAKQSPTHGDWSAGVELKGSPGEPGKDGEAGGNGWTPKLAAVTDGARRVFKVVDWLGGTGTKPAINNYLGASGWVSDIAAATDFRGPIGQQGDQGVQGIQGGAGWTPVLGTASDGARRVFVVTDWTGGSGTKPATGKYLAASGWVDDIAAALDVRGAQGLQGIQGFQGDTGNKGWSPVLAAANDGARRVAAVIDWTGGEGAKPTALGYLAATGLTAVLADAIDLRGSQGVQGIQGNQGLQGIQGAPGQAIEVRGNDGAQQIEWRLAGSSEPWVLLVTYGAIQAATHTHPDLEAGIAQAKSLAVAMAFLF